jgi:signal transduction histidine kinase
MVATADAEPVVAAEDSPGEPWFRHLAWPLGVLSLLACVLTATLVVLNRSAIHTLAQADPVELFLPIGYAIIGALLASRRPRSPIGWLFLGIAIFTALPGIATEYVFRSSHFHALPLVSWVGWTADWMDWLVFPSGFALFFFLLFPDGRLQSRRWRWLAWSGLVVLVAGTVMLMLQRTIQLTGSPTMRNPLGSVAVVDMQNGAPGLIWLVALALILTAMTGIIFRTRRSTGELHQQLRWLSYATFATAVGLVANLVIGIVFNDGGWWDVVILLGFGVAVPVSCGIAILKHSLYDLDVVISKTLIYVALAAFFTAVYVAVVVGVGSAVGSTRNPFLTVVAAAVIALAFNPVRERAKRLANRIVYGKRASPYEVLSEFADRMAETYSLDDVLPRMARILGEGTGAQQARVWLRIGDELRPDAVWGEADVQAKPVPVRHGELPSIANVSKVVAVRDRGDLSGALSVTKPQNEPLTSAEGKLVDDLAAQAGLVLRNVRLTEELRDNLEELRASRQRIVAAQDEARRRLERNIHDGAQQQLVALAVKVRLADGLVGRDDDGAHSVLAQLQGEAQEALENLRDLARGIYPPLLADQGLVAALEAQARKSPVPVSVEAEGISRYSQEQEAAVYFCVLEALQNVAKYAGPTRTTVHLAERDGRLTFAVADDGVGFDASATGYGSGLQGMADRLAALAGELEVRSAPGRGTTVSGSLPATAQEPTRVSALLQLGH